MNDAMPNTQPATPDLARIGHAKRFAIACVVMGLSCLTISSCLNIPRFARIFTDMLGENQGLPVLTTYVLGAHTALLALSFCIPVAAIALVFTRDIARSLYCLGILFLISMVEYVVVNHAKYSPLVRIIEKMQGTDQ